MTREETVRFTVVAHENDPVSRAEAEAQKQWDHHFEEQAAVRGSMGRGASLRYVSGLPQSPGSRYMVYTFEGSLLHQD